MIVIFYGTSAELIKLLGVIKRVPRQQLYLVCSAQHYGGLQKLHEQLKIQPDLMLSTGWRHNDIRTIMQMILTMLIIHVNFMRHVRSIRKMLKKYKMEHGVKNIAIVHGDTLTTVIGCYMGWILGLKVAHVEAGLRTHNWRSPFPEEIDRRIAAKFARIHFAPNDIAVKDLEREKVKGSIIHTRYNTAKDAIEMSDKYTSDSFKDLKLPAKYCLVLLHRTELIENKEDLEAILKTIYSYASKTSCVVFTQHSTTWQKIQQYNLKHYLEKEGITILPKQPYFDYMQIVRKSSHIVTDGGGLQEDAYFFGIPALIHRKISERPDGLGVNATLSKMNISLVEDFLNNPPTKKRRPHSMDKISPSEIVVETLRSKSFIS